MGRGQSDSVLLRLEALHPKVIDLSLDRVLRLLAALGHPEDQLPPVVHVAGTNGKGSVLAFLGAIFAAHGLRCHVFTSPHLIRFHERIVVAGKEIAEGSLVEVLEECERVNAGAPITFFEITTAAALLAFARTPADITLLETGLGGRLDATNVVARPAATVLTPIALDHQSFLGETVAEIAAEKAGILKQGTPCFSSQQAAEAASVIRNRAKALEVPLVWESEHWRARRDGNGMLYEAFGRSSPGSSSATDPQKDHSAWRLPAPGLAGHFQLNNAGLAIACAQSMLGTSLRREAVARGIHTAHWPARLQRINAGILRDLLPEDWELWLDGAHNPAAAAALAAEARQNWHDRPNAFIVGMLRTKDASGFLTTVAGNAERVVAVTVPEVAASLTAAELRDLGQSVGLAVEPAASVEDALRTLATDMSGPARAVICGSLYLAGWVLTRNAPHLSADLGSSS
jgi:dihydrofolate synthase / folylpolyglutamate synthase